MAGSQFPQLPQYDTTSVKKEGCPKAPVFFEVSENTAKKLSSASTEAPDVRAIMAEIRERVRSELGERADGVLSPFELFVKGSGGAEARVGEMVHSEKLRDLNAAHSFAIASLNPDTISSHRPLIGKPLVWAKRKVLTFLRDGIFKEYFQQQHLFNATLVQFLNELSRSGDLGYWQLAKKIEQGANRINDEHVASVRFAERRIIDQVNSELQSVRSELNTLRTENSESVQQVQTLETVTRGLEKIISRSNGTPSAVETASTETLPEPETDYSYLLLENRFRGSEEMISKRLEIYPDVFANNIKPVLEIGCGRGELLELFRAKNIESYGVELDAAMVAHCTEKNLTVRLGDGIAHLNSLEDQSLGGVIATQVIEHLNQTQLQTLIALCAKKVVPGGKIVFETINSGSIVALTQNYFRDPTHVWPLHPETMEFLLELGGLRVAEVKKLAPFPKEAELEEIQIESYMPPRWADTIERLNKNFRQLNRLLYGFQDYCIIAEVQD